MQAKENDITPPTDECSFGETITIAPAAIPDDTESALKTAVETNPQDAQACFRLGNLYFDKGAYHLAYPYYKQAATLLDTNWEVWSRFSRCLLNLTHFGAAVIAAKKAADLQPGNALHWVNLAAALSKAQLSEDAMTALATAIEISPDCAPAHFMLGQEYAVRGEFTEARAALKRALECDPNFHLAHYTLANLTADAEDAREMLVTLESLVESGQASTEIESRLLFAVAYLKNLTEDFDGAFSAYQRANTIEHNECLAYDRDAHDRLIDQSIETFGKDVLETLADAGNDSQTPVFVVGMPRSGTTLATQILSSHPHISSAGELSRIQQLVANLQAIPDAELTYPNDIARFNTDGLRAMATDYLSCLSQVASGDANRIVDKLPSNFMNLGLISILFPRATIIHCRRNALDTCLSCYFQRFDRPNLVTFANDLEDIAHYYRGYERIMAHWHKVMPGRILDVQYEELVADQENWSRKIITHTGLDWDDTCLDVGHNDSRVDTASVLQARQPIYKSSVERWRKYEAHIGPLKNALKCAA